MRRCIGHAKYIIVHKWYTMIECFRFGLYWRGIVHDLTKFLPQEFLPSARTFYHKSGKRRPKYWQYYNPDTQNDIAFEKSRLLHQGRNDHHWQFWVLVMDTGQVKGCEIPRDAMLEMIADWIGTRKVQNLPDVGDWYRRYKNLIYLHPRTRTKVEKILKERGEL